MQLDETFPCYPRISERDVNLLLVEEMMSSEDFQSKLLQAVGIQLIPHEDASGIRGYTEVCLPGECSAEIDVIVVAECSRTSDSRSAYLLIENKIDVDFQPLQPVRYSGQAKALVKEGYTDVAKTLLVAPQAYIASHGPGVKLFDAAVSYEQIRDWIASAAGSSKELRRRAAVKCTLLQQGILKQKRLMPQIISPVVSLSWSEVHSIATRDFPDLQMPPPGDKGRSSWSIDLPCITRRAPLNKARLEYVLKKGDHIPEPGTVTILMPGLGEFIESAKASLTKILATGMSIRKAGKSLGITVSVDFVEPGKAFEPQQEKLAIGFQAAREMRDWYERNRAELERFATVCLQRPSA